MRFRRRTVGRGRWFVPVVLIRKISFRFGKYNAAFWCNRAALNAVAYILPLLFRCLSLSPLVLLAYCQTLLQIGLIKKPIWWCQLKIFRTLSLNCLRWLMKKWYGLTTAICQFRLGQSQMDQCAVEFVSQHIKWLCVSTWVACMSTNLLTPMFTRK